MMNIITILLCALANQVMTHTNDIYPARILAQQKTLSENSDLYLTCSTFGSKKHTNVFIYLCKDDHGIQIMSQREEQNDSTFTIRKVGTNYSGNYSCVYSKNNYLLSEVVTRGSNIVQILVIANLLPADISVSGPSTVSEGDNVEFRCTVSDALKTLNECQLIHSYLKKNETVLQVQAFNVTRMEATFTIGAAVMRDSGHYSCLVLPSKCIQEHEKILHGNNAVFLQVSESLVLKVIFPCGVIIQMLLLAPCLWWVNKQACHSALCNPCEDSQQANKNVFEEQEEQTEGRDLDGEDEESFSTDDEEGSQNGLAVADSIYYGNFEAVYDVADESSSTDNKEGSKNGLAVEDSTFYGNFEAVYDVADDEPSRPRVAPLYTTSFKAKRLKISPVC
ncbi:uncharacterized protein [Thunnus thynnus]|uniref:uncharacterized protein isoform X2 n=1 Tax=Thunnus thynnus TaxID=8237 RepID=UPI003528C260